jgi:hypothetical protein
MSYKEVEIVNEYRREPTLMTAFPVAESTMTCIIARKSAYAGQEITSDQMMASTLDLQPKAFDWIIFLLITIQRMFCPSCIGIDLLEVLINAIDQFLLGGHADSSQHRSRHLAELILDEVQPQAVRGEHEDEVLRHGLQVAPCLFGDVRGMVVQHQADLLVLRIGAVEFLQEADEVGAFVRIAYVSVIVPVCKSRPANSDTMARRSYS